ncbi:MAG: hypothetical protein Q8K36_03010 [Alphaproteobacteria bacterium]|nr:hypothetical protein [Alphaproteobacteria bacterium]
MRGNDTIFGMRSYNIKVVGKDNLSFVLKLENGKAYFIKLIQ